MRALALLLLAAALHPGHAQPPTQPDSTQPTSPQPPSPEAPAFPGQPAPNPAARYRIAGTIVSATDGHPLQRADVRIFATNRNGVPVQSVTADPYGRFLFTDVPAGTFMLQGSATGFVPGSYEEHGNFNTGIVTGAGVDTESLVLKLQPQGAISLTVTDESGEPVQRANISLYRQSNELGQGRFAQVNGGSTDDLGRFHSVPLAPGAYYLVVHATPWYAVHPMSRPQAPDGQPQQPSFGFVDSIQSGLDVAYPITYYPGGTNAANASAIKLRGGDTVELSMQLHAEPAYTITLPGIQRANIDGARIPVSVPQLTATVFGQTEYIGAQQQATSDSVTFFGVAPGDYVLRQNGSPSGPGTPVRVTDHSIAPQLAPPSPSAHVTAELRSTDGTRIAPPTQLVITHNHTAYRRVVVDQAAKATFDIEPGDYGFSVLGGSRSLFLRQVFERGQPVAGNRVHLTPGAQAAYVLSVVPGNHALRGKVQRDGQPAPGVFLLLIPTADLADPHLFYRDQSDLDGSFQLRGLAAGDYTLFAIQDGWDLDWHQKAIFDRFLPHATTVHIADDAPQTQTLPTPIPAQPR